jgi:hypothetical protein
MSAKIDAVSSLVNGSPLSTLTLSHVVANQDDRILLVAVHVEDANTLDRTVSGITYNGIPLTFLDFQETSVLNNRIELWYLLAPPVGTFSVVVTMGGTCTNLSAGVIGIYNAMQQPPEIKNKASGTVSPVSVSIATVSGQSLIVSIGQSSIANPVFTHGVEQAEQYQTAMGSSRGTASTEIATVAGLNVQQELQTGASALTIIAAAFTGKHEINVSDSILVVEVTTVAAAPTTTYAVNVFDNIATIESYVINLSSSSIVLNEVLTISENISVVLDHLTVNASQGILINDADIIDIIIEASVLTDEISVADQAAISMNYMFVSVIDNVIVEEASDALRSILNMSVLENINITEFFDNQAYEFSLTVFDDVAATDEASRIRVQNGQVAAPPQGGSQFDPSTGRYWRARYDIGSQSIRLEYTLNPEGVWTENENARITDPVISNDFDMRAGNVSVGIIYKTNDDIVLRQVALSQIVTTTWVWSEPVTVFSESGKKYSSAVIGKSLASGFIMAIATKSDGVNHQLVSKKSTTANNLTSWESEQIVGNSITGAVRGTIVGTLALSEAFLAVFQEGNALMYALYSAGAWGAVQTKSTDISSYLFSDLGSFDLYMTSLGKCQLVYVTNQRHDVMHSVYIFGTGWSQDVVVFSGENYGQPGIGEFDNENYIAFSFMNFDSGQIQYRLKNMAEVFNEAVNVEEADDHHVYSIVTSSRQGSSNYIVEVYSGGTINYIPIQFIIRVSDNVLISEEATIFYPVLGVQATSDFVSVSENVSIAISVSIDRSDDVSVTEFVNKSDGLLFFNVKSDILITEDEKNQSDLLFALAIEPFEIIVTSMAQIFDGLRFVGPVSDFVVVMEAKAAYPTTLHPFAPDLPTGLAGQHRVDEFVEMSLPVAISAVFEAVDASENVKASIPLNVGVSDSLAVVDVNSVVRDPAIKSGVDAITVTMFAAVRPDRLFMSANDNILVEDGLTVLPNPLNVVAADSVTVAEVGSFTDIVVELGVVFDSIAVAGAGGEKVILSIFSPHVDVSVHDNLQVIGSQGWIGVTPLHLSVYQLLGVGEMVSVVDEVVELWANDNVAVAEFQHFTSPFELNDIMVEVPSMAMDANTILLLHMDGSFEDSSPSPKIVTAFGNAIPDTTDPKFGSHSCLLDGVGDYLTMPWSADLDFGIGDFTLETGIKYTDTPLIHWLFARGQDQACDIAWSSGLLYAFIAGTNYTTPFVPTPGVWYHVVLVRKAGVIKLLVNGVTLLTASAPASITSTSGYFIGCLGTPMYFTKGRLDEVRISNVARFFDDFTPPSAPYGGDVSDDIILVEDVATMRLPVLRLSAFESVVVIDDGDVDIQALSLTVSDAILVGDFGELLREIKLFALENINISERVIVRDSEFKETPRLFVFLPRVRIFISNQVGEVLVL